MVYGIYSICIYGIYEGTAFEQGDIHEISDSKHRTKPSG